LLEDRDYQTGTMTQKCAARPSDQRGPGSASFAKKFALLECPEVGPPRLLGALRRPAPLDFRQEEARRWNNEGKGERFQRRAKRHLP
jgi:hypothetical protein